MSKDPYAILHALLRAEAIRNAPKPAPDTRQRAPKPTPEKQVAPPKDHERD